MTPRPRRRANPHDPRERKRGLRKGRERGCSIYIRAGELALAGFTPGGDLPYYEAWGRPGGSVLVRLYREG